MERKRKKYTIEQMNMALEAVKCGTSITRASKTFSIPKTTLIDKINHKYPDGATPGAHTVLTAQEEETVVNWILYLQNIGFPVTRSQLIESVGKLVTQLNRESPFKDGVPGRHWYENFLKRHPQLSHRISQNLTQPRAKITEKDIRGWFARVHEYITENNLEEILSDPRRIFNSDESAFYLSPKEKQVIVQKGSKKVYIRTQNDEKECLTVLVTVAAEGTMAPPLVLFPYKRMPTNIIRKMPKDWGLGRSDTGWMTGESFYEYVTNVFYPWLVKTCIPLPVILFLDGHSSHINLPLSEFCREKGIILIALLPNSTHLLQPLDVAVFRPLKNAWRIRIQKWRIDSNGEKLRREDFASQLNLCLQEEVTEQTIRNGFRSCGLYPFDENNINYSKLLAQVQLETKVLDENKNNGESNIADIPEALRIIPNDKLLFEIEKRIDEATLREFKISTDEWKGAEKDESLFYFWKKISKESDENIEDHNETLNANLPDLMDIDIDDSAWLNNNSLFLEVHSDGTVEVPKINVPNISDYELRTPEKASVLPSSTNTFKNHADSNEHNLKILENAPKYPQDLLSSKHSDNKMDKNTDEKDSSNVRKNNEVNTNDMNSDNTNKINNSLKEKPLLPTPLKNIETPFKNALFWPESKNKEKVKKAVRKITPTVVSSNEYIEYQRRIDFEKKKKEEEKAERSRKRKVDNKENKSAHLPESSKKYINEESVPESLDKQNKSRKEGDFVVVEYEGEYFPGIINRIEKNGILVKSMAMTLNAGHWKWPDKEDILLYSEKDIICNIKAPTLINNRGIYFVPEMVDLKKTA